MAWESQTQTQVNSNDYDLEKCQEGAKTPRKWCLKCLILAGAVVFLIGVVIYQLVVPGFGAQLSTSNSSIIIYKFLNESDEMYNISDIELIKVELNATKEELNATKEELNEAIERINQISLKLNDTEVNEEGLKDEKWSMEAKLRTKDDSYNKLWNNVKERVNALPGDIKKH